MTKEELQNKLNFVNDNELQKEIIIYAATKSDEVYELDINGEHLKEMIPMFCKSVKRIVFDEEYELKNYSTADERNNCYYRYDLLEKPKQIEWLSQVIADDNIPKFNSKNNRIEEITSLIIILSAGDERVSLFKCISEVEKHITYKGMWIFQSSERFERIDKDILRISPSFHMLRIDEDVIITNFKSLEHLLGLDLVWKNEAKRDLDLLSPTNIISNMETINGFCEGDKSFCKKVVAAVKSSPVLYRGVQNTRIIQFAKEKETKLGKFHFTDDDSQFDIRNKTEAKRFLDLISDNVLKSELTDEDYLVKAKDELKVNKPSK